MGGMGTACRLFSCRPTAHGAEGPPFPKRPSDWRGILSTIGAGKLMTQQLFSVKPWDPVMVASATLALRLAALLASALPAWRTAARSPWWRYGMSDQTR
jgi:hypothetical protein